MNVKNKTRKDYTECSLHWKTNIARKILIESITEVTIRRVFEDNLRSVIFYVNKQEESCYLVSVEKW